MCCGPYDFDYPTYGGIHHRSNPSFGRLGSTFSDPNFAGGGPSADSNLKPHPEPKGDRDLGLDDESLEGDLDLDRVDEDLDDDLEGLDDDLEELDRRLEELDQPEKDLDTELESIEPLEDVNLKRGSRNQAQSFQRRRGALPRRSMRLR
jgi:hypothetical protein